MSSQQPPWSLKCLFSPPSGTLSSYLCELHLKLHQAYVPERKFSDKPTYPGLHALQMLPAASAHLSSLDPAPPPTSEEAEANPPQGSACARLPGAQQCWVTPDYSLFPDTPHPLLQDLRPLFPRVPRPQEASLPSRSCPHCPPHRPCVKAALSVLAWACVDLSRRPFTAYITAGLHLPYSQVPQCFAQ